MKTIASGLLFGIVISGCATHGVNRMDAEQIVEVEYARVMEIKPIHFDSKAGEAAIVGGVEGAIYNIGDDSEDVIAGALTGALLSALTVSLDEGSSRGLLLSLKTADNSSYNLVTRHTDIKLNDCLRLLKGSEVSVDRVESEFCD